MLLAHPAVLEGLLTRYEKLVRRRDELLTSDATDAAPVLRRLEDVSYTLCVSTGTRDIDEALAAAREQLAGTEREVWAVDRTLPADAPGTPASAAPSSVTDEGAALAA
ncbi:DUF5133 domain-containing protein [uncultured Streptomyces sp.]|uniref:DUF5133 domain-containing protein n=1 Tax=uncultured Streptomyces sp. TaxID=174707 RepID=UPI00262D452C|nr:DUF5133 domain-containing protein [uncultured Streptomyces sp.]